MSSPDRADVKAIVEDAVNRAVEYWGTAHDEEAAILAELHVADVKITRGQLQEMVEAKIAIDWADQHADLSRFGWPDDCDWFTRAEFIREQREQWFESTLATVVTRTREARRFESADLPLAA
jgi:hypothetical protein